MKTIFFKILVIIVAGCYPKTIWAYHFEANGIYYNIVSSNTAEVTYGNNKYSGNIVIPPSVENEGTTFQVVTIGNLAFADCTDLTAITIAEGISMIDYSAFSGCSNLSTVSFPESLSTISYSAFYGCINLRAITLTKGLTSIDGSAFQKCSNLQQIYIDNENSHYTSVDGVLFDKNLATIVAFPMGKATTYIIPEGTATIGDYAFAGCNNLSVVTIASSITSIGNWAFEGCYGLTALTIPEKVTQIGNYAFSGCSGLLEIILPEGITSIGNSAFASCSKLSAIAIPQGITTIGEYTFSGCSNLVSIEIPESITSIGNSAFSGCSSLNAITIPQGIKTIPFRAFSDCSSLTTITIPRNISTIGNYAFNGCTNLQEIHSLDTIPPTCGSKCFYDIDKTVCTLYVPVGATAAYKTASQWKNFIHIIEEEPASNETIIGNTIVTKIYAISTRIVIENLPTGSPITIYTLSGKVVYEGIAQTCRTDIALPLDNIYLVNCAGKISKIAL